MSDVTWAALRQLLVERYDDLRKLLTRRLNSDELAREMLHETWLRLDREDKVGPIRSPTGYILRTAVNIAVDRERRESRAVRPQEIADLLSVPDLGPDPAAAAEARLEIEALERAYQELTPRRRAILYAARIEGKPFHRIASELGISQRLVEMELRHAIEHCGQRLDRNVIRIFGPRRPETS